MFSVRVEAHLKPAGVLINVSSIRDKKEMVFKSAFWVGYQSFSELVDKLNSLGLAEHLDNEAYGNIIIYYHPSLNISLNNGFIEVCKYYLNKSIPK